MNHLTAVILPIKPKFADLIILGKKRWEFRRRIFKNDVKKVMIYATAPKSAVIGEFTIEQIYHLPLEQLTELWRAEKDYTGLDEREFKQYFSGRDSGYVIAIGSVRRYPQELDIQELGLLRPPQSFVYVRYA